MEILYFDDTDNPDDPGYRNRGLKYTPQKFRRELTLALQ
jgi:hypothetical protein